MFWGCLCWWGADCLCALCFRDRALSSRAPLHDHHGGKLHRDGGAVPHAGAGCPLQGLAGPPGRHHLPLPADAVLLGVSISSSCQVKDSELLALDLGDAPLSGSVRASLYI